jgi:hypothetical protein
MIKQMLAGGANIKWIAAGLGVAVVLYYIGKNGKNDTDNKGVYPSKSKKGNVVTDVSKGVARGAVRVVDGVIGGVVEGAGEMIGIPRTNETECEKAKREGRTWDASFACDAWTFITK